jgi:hypothetical protein
MKVTPPSGKILTALKSRLHESGLLVFLPSDILKPATIEGNK